MFWLLSCPREPRAHRHRGSGDFRLRASPSTRPPAGSPDQTAPAGNTANEAPAEVGSGLNPVAACLGRLAAVPPARFAVLLVSTVPVLAHADALPGSSCFTPGTRRPFSKGFGSAAGSVVSYTNGGPRLAAFALPLVFSFHSGKHKRARIRVREFARPGAGESRRSSPLWLRVLPTPEGKFFTPVHVFKSMLDADPSDRLEFYMKATPLAGALQAPPAPFPAGWNEADGFIRLLKEPESYVC